ncbi:alcohol dehydrogenase [Marinococcus halophilus]|uniref:Putative zinc-type alcohol dehydrogenase-like protein YjmD n=1 Tax=Marinococcus halophilus TaxID=1371 RepID=A0A510Y8P9_MARHA|nr:zinc-binding alcohol dehydrogenase family protein [Marinococcus halophilus]OZT79705.1 alcohol dehydrogenase [Marinococcus halophilus]GEK59061.1 putative zinc-type alcohol dehydrogenase-like protein YjmD [Marinococcus halophilus]
MKAIQVSEPGQLNVIEIEKPRIENEHEVLVKVHAAGICGSDMHIYHGSNPFTVYPRIIGHEVAGEVAEIGESVHSLQVGDKVSLEPIQSCGECYACKQGQPNVCENLEVYGVHRDGGMREFMSAPEKNWHKLDEETSWNEAVLTEPLTIGAQATARGGVKEGDTVLITGAGPTGISCLLVAKLKKARVIMTDLNDERLNYASSIGADVTINPGNEPDVFDRVSQETNGMMANVVIDAVGTEKTFEQAVSMASIAGRVVTLGFNKAPSSLTSLDITKKELMIVGSRLQSNKFPEIIEYINQGKLDVESMVSHRFNFQDVQQAFEQLESAPNEVRKAVLAFG